MSFKLGGEWAERRHAAASGRDNLYISLNNGQSISVEGIWNLAVTLWENVREREGNQISNKTFLELMELVDKTLTSMIWRHDMRR